MGRDVQYSPFTWQNQSPAHNRFLKFLVVIILLSLVSFYIGYPASGIDETPRTESSRQSTEYQRQQLAKIRYEEKTRNDEVTIEHSPSSELSQPSFGSSSNETSHASQLEASSFNDSVVPSGPGLSTGLSGSLSENPEEKLRKLEEEERKIIESQESEAEVKDAHHEDLTVSSIEIEGIAGDQEAGKVIHGEPGTSQDGAKQGEQGSETISAPSQDSGNSEKPEATGAEHQEATTPSSQPFGTSETPEVGDQEPEKKEQEDLVEEETTKSSDSFDALQIEESQEALGDHGPEPSSTDSSLVNNDSAEKNSTSTNQIGAVTETSPSTTASSDTVDTSMVGIEEAEKQVEQVSMDMSEAVGMEGAIETATVVEDSFIGTTNSSAEIVKDITNATTTHSQSGQDEEQEQSPKPQSVETTSACHIEDWNNITLDLIPHQSVFKQWLSQNAKGDSNETQDDQTPRVLGAFAYKSHIAVTLSGKNFSSEKVYCRYYDCHKKQLVRQMASFVFPESTVYCPRRAGAKYISISENLEDRGQSPVQIMKRQVPNHFFTVCVGMNGHEENILKIARFIEYYKLQGSTFFHVYLKNSSYYQRMLLDDYVRTGDVKVVKIGENVTEEVQANDCQHRNKYFSKWTAFLNLEDQLETKEEGMTISSYLDTITDHKTNILKWNSLESNDTTRLLIRPERIVSINNNPIMVYLGNQLSENEESSGVLKQFTNSTELSPGSFAENVDENVPFRDELIENVISRTKHVFTTIEMDNQKQEESISTPEATTTMTEEATVENNEETNNDDE